jgi:uncharacterized protein (TIGR01777 family)
VRVLITGGTGFVGSPLLDALLARGDEVFCLTRNPLREPRDNLCYIGWNGQKAPLNLPDNISLVINLMGENIAAKRWSASQRKQLHDSRILSTRLLIEGLRQIGSKPDLFISASASGFYGNRGAEILTESSQSGTGFLPELARQWESEALRAEDILGCSVALIRLGVVLGTQGGALKKMLLPFSLGLGGRLGDGTQYMSWLSLRDAVSAIVHVIDKKLSGPINLCTPEPLTNTQFTRELGRALKRPTVFPVPEFVLSLVFGQMGRDLLLASTRALPERLLKSGFEFHDSEIGSIIRSSR